MEPYDPAYIQSYFDSFAEQEWARLERSPVDEVKLWIHIDFLNQFVKTEDRVLEIGAGPGRFTRELVQLGCSVTVSDISTVQLELNRARAAREGYEAAIGGWHRVDVVSMQQFAAESFDVVVCFGGPLSYALDQRRRAAEECFRVVRPGGFVLLSVMSLWGGAHDGLGYVITVPMDSNRLIVETGDVTGGTLPGHKHPSHLFRSAELRELLEGVGFEVVAMSASNCLSTRWHTELATIRADAQRWAELLDLEKQACTEPGCVDMGSHILAAARKSTDA